MDIAFVSVFPNPVATNSFVCMLIQGMSRTRSLQATCYDHYFVVLYLRAKPSLVVLRLQQLTIYFSSEHRVIPYLYFSLLFLFNKCYFTETFS